MVKPASWNDGEHDLLNKLTYNIGTLCNNTPTLIASSTGHYTNGGDQNHTIITPFDSTGAKFIIVYAESTQLFPNPVDYPAISDNYGNTWTMAAGTSRILINSCFYYCNSASVGPNHTITLSISGLSGGRWSGGVVGAFSGNIITPYSYEYSQSVGNAQSLSSTLPISGTLPSGTLVFVGGSTRNINATSATPIINGDVRMIGRVSTVATSVFTAQIMSYKHTRNDTPIPVTLTMSPLVTTDFMLNQVAFAY